MYGKFEMFNANGDALANSIAGNEYFFTARRYEAKSGLYYYRARFYSPVLGRFLQPDPIGYGDGLNIYAYCKNNPVNFVDPTGKFWHIGIAALVGGVIGAVVGGVVATMTAEDGDGLRAGIVGALSGFGAGAVAGALVSVGCPPIIAGAVGGVSNSAASQYGNGENLTSTKGLIKMGASAVVGGIASSASNALLNCGTSSVSALTNIPRTSADKVIDAVVDGTIGAASSVFSTGVDTAIDGVETLNNCAN